MCAASIQDLGCQVHHVHSLVQFLLPAGKKTQDPFISAALTSSPGGPGPQGSNLL